MDTPWAYTHRARLKFAITSIIVISLTVYLAIRLYVPPSCFDGKRNQDEVGIDCGGGCDLYCASQVGSVKTSWINLFEVSPGWWSVLAYLENPNFDKWTDYLPYRIVLYDEAGTQLLERKGITYANSELTIPIFEGRFPTKDKTPTRATFEWLDTPVWYKPRDTHRVTTEQHELFVAGVGHELQVTVVNGEPFPVRDVTVVAILYDTRENPLAVSETYIDYMGLRERKRVSFSWPRPFPEAVGRIEFIPRVPAQE